MGFRDISAATVLAALRAGACTLGDLAQRFEVLSSSRFLADALTELGRAGMVLQYDDGRLVPNAARHTIYEVPQCQACGLKPFDAPDLQPGEFVCTCNTPFEEEF